MVAGKSACVIGYTGQRGYVSCHPPGRRISARGSGGTGPPARSGAGEKGAEVQEDWKSKLARKAVAALLNAESGMNYPLSVDEIKSRVSNKFQSGNESSIKYLHTQLENYNANNNFPLN